MKIRLEKINKDNWEEALDLRVAEDHKKYVASNLYSIAEAQFYPGCKTYAIYNDAKMVGFAMLGVDTEDETDKRFWLIRFMIAAGEQYKGYGKEAMKLIIEEVRKNNHSELVLSTNPDNEKGIRFYKSLGFETTGTIQDGEEVFILDLNQN